MKFAVSRVLISLSVWMLLANALCYARCLVQPCCKKTASMPCHSSGKTASAACAHYNDLAPSVISWNSSLDGAVTPDLPIAASAALLDPFREYLANSDPSPPWIPELSVDSQLRV